MLRSTKESIVNGLQERLKDSQIALCADYRGLTVDQMGELRNELRAVNASAKVVKNSLLKRSFANAHEEKGPEEEKFLDLLQGPTLLISAIDDPIGPAKVLAKYVKEFEHLEAKGGYFEGEFLTEAKIQQLSKMPGREELLGKLLRTILAPGTNLVRLLNEPGSQVVRVIDAHRRNMAA